MTFTGNPLSDHGKHTQNMFGWRETAWRKWGNPFTSATGVKLQIPVELNVGIPPAVERQVLLFLLL